jgi:hypothetical protein
MNSLNHFDKRIIMAKFIPKWLVPWGLKKIPAVHGMVIYPIKII